MHLIAGSRGNATNRESATSSRIRVSSIISIVVDPITKKPQRSCFFIFVIRHSRIRDPAEKGNESGPGERLRGTTQEDISSDGPGVVTQ